jgi:hypothetical protein
VRPLLCRFWQDDSGSLLVTDWAFVATILMLGILCAAASARNRQHPEQINSEMSLTCGGDGTAD